MTTDLDERLADLRRPVDWPAARACCRPRTRCWPPTPHREGRDHRLVAARPRRRVPHAGGRGRVWPLQPASRCPTLVPAGSPGSADQAAAVQALHQLARSRRSARAITSGRTSICTWSMSSTRTRWPVSPRRTAVSRTGSAPTGSPGSGAPRARRPRPAHVEVWLLPPGPQAIDGMSARNTSIDCPPTRRRWRPTCGRTPSGPPRRTSGSSSRSPTSCAVDWPGPRSARPRSRSSPGSGTSTRRCSTRDSLGNPVQAFEFVGSARTSRRHPDRHVRHPHRRRSPRNTSTSTASCSSPGRCRCSQVVDTVPAEHPPAGRRPEVSTPASAHGRGAPERLRLMVDGSGPVDP